MFSQVLDSQGVMVIVNSVMSLLPLPFFFYVSTVLLISILEGNLLIHFQLGNK